MFASTSSSIAEGDLVILYYGRENVNSTIIEAGKDINSRYGHFRHNDMMGVPYGTKFPSSNGRGFVYVLRPTPELWTQALSHRTQILYMPDIAFICSYLNMRPGSVVVEAGTGSGSFSHSVARTIGSEGRLYSFEFHEERFTEAKAEFEQHKVNQITLQHRNVCKDGFGEEVEQGIADSVFLDLPAPWEAVESAKKALKKDRPSRICCFSPCIEQVIRTVTALGTHGFSEITMYETLIRTYEPIALPDGKPPTVRDAINKLKAVVEKKDVRRKMQIETARARKEERDRAKEAKGAAGAISAEKGEEEKSEETAKKDQSKEKEAERPAKRVRVEDSTATNSEVDTTAKVDTSKTVTLSQKKPRSYVSEGSVLKPMPQQRGHTSYLTFATLMPLTPSSESVEEEPVPAISIVENGATLAPPAKNGLKKTTSLVTLAQEDVEMMTEGISFADTQESG